MLSRIFTALTVLALFSTGSSFGAEILSLDAEKSKIDFVGRKSDGMHKGGFKAFKVKSIADFEDPAGSTLEIEIDTASLWSDDEKLTNHLKNPDFFDVRKFPKINFKATQLIPEEEGKAKVVGNLTMLGKTVEVTIPCDVAVNDESIDLSAKFKIDRTLWGMEYGVGKIEKDVEIAAKFVLNR
jgi:polyisoprenoid-binding protein YceI